MSDKELLDAVFELRDLVRLIAEPHIAIRDEKLRTELARVVGNSSPKQKSVLAMDGTRTQMEIHKETRMHLGNLSTLVKQLVRSRLLVGDPKKPKLVIQIPPNFFDRKGDK